MNARLATIGLLLSLTLTASACDASAPEAGPKPMAPQASRPGPAMRCRHPLTTFGDANGLPGSVASQLRTWMALRGEHWNKTDAISQGELTAGFLWAGSWNGDWVVAYSVGGVDCCSTRFALFTPAAPGSAAYRWITPPSGAPDNFGDASCSGIDAALDAYGARR